MYIRQLKVERRLSITASQTAAETQAKAEPKPKGEEKAKAKAEKSLKSPKAKGDAAWSQSPARSRNVYAHVKPRVAAVKEGAKPRRPQ
ncbi:hypothetical protein N339_11770, partial [Pterocles gutturalis]